MLHISLSTIFATTEPSGIGALGLNVKSFIFQLISFLIVLYLLKKFVFKKIVKVLDERAALVIKTNQDAQEAAAMLQDASKQSAELLTDAQIQSAEIIAEAKAAARRHTQESIKKTDAEIAQMKNAAKEQTLIEAEQIRRELLKETAGLVAATTEKIMQKQLGTKEQERILKSAEKELQK